MNKKDNLAERLKNNKAFEELFSKGSNEGPGFEAVWYARDGNMDMYFMGYENAVMILLEWFLKPSDDNGTIYPLIFLIRHTLELGLKESIRRALKLGSKSISISELEKEKVWTTHNLQFLSKICEKVLSGFKISEYGDWNEAKKFMQKWQEADPKATFGKYPVSKEGVPYDVKGNVHAEKVVKMGIKAIETLDGLLSMLEEYLNIQSEMYDQMKDEI